MPDIILLYIPHSCTDASTSLAFSFAITWETGNRSHFTEAKAATGVAAYYDTVSQGDIKKAYRIQKDLEM